MGYLWEPAEDKYPLVRNDSENVRESWLLPLMARWGFYDVKSSIAEEIVTRIMQINTTFLKCWDSTDKTYLKKTGSRT